MSQLFAFSNLFFLPFVHLSIYLFIIFKDYFYAESPVCILDAILTGKRVKM